MQDYQNNIYEGLKFICNNKSYTVIKEHMSKSEFDCVCDTDKTVHTFSKIFIEKHLQTNNTEDTILYDSCNKKYSITFYSDYNINIKPSCIKHITAKMLHNDTQKYVFENEKGLYIINYNAILGMMPI